jgi:hypothetical protein
MTRAYPARLTQMSDMQKMNRILDLEAANEKCGEKIAAAIAAEREAQQKRVEHLASVAYKAVAHVAAANYQERELQANDWIAEATE